MLAWSAQRQADEDEQERRRVRELQERLLLERADVPELAATMSRLCAAEAPSRASAESVRPARRRPEGQYEEVSEIAFLEDERERWRVEKIQRILRKRAFGAKLDYLPGLLGDSAAAAAAGGAAEAAADARAAAAAAATAERAAEAEAELADLVTEIATEAAMLAHFLRGIEDVFPPPHAAERQWRGQQQAAQQQQRDDEDVSERQTLGAGIGSPLAAASAQAISPSWDGTPARRLREEVTILRGMVGADTSHLGSPAAALLSRRLSAGSACSDSDDAEFDDVQEAEPTELSAPTPSQGQRHLALRQPDSREHKPELLGVDLPEFWDTDLLRGGRLFSRWLRLFLGTDGTGEETAEDGCRCQ